MPQFPFELIHFGCSILSKFPMANAIDEEGLKRNRVRSVSGSIQLPEVKEPICVTSLHLGKKLLATILK